MVPMCEALIVAELLGISIISLCASDDMLIEIEKTEIVVDDGEDF